VVVTRLDRPLSPLAGRSKTPTRRPYWSLVVLPGYDTFGSAPRSSDLIRGSHLRFQQTAAAGAESCRSGWCVHDAATNLGDPEGSRQTAMCTHLWISWGLFTWRCAPPVYNLGKTQVTPFKHADRYRFLDLSTCGWIKCGVSV